MSTLKLPSKGRNHNSIFSARRASTRQKDPMTIGLQRQSKRLSRQQKRLEKEIALSNVYDLSGQQASTSASARQKVIHYQDIKELEPLTDTQKDFFESYDDESIDAFVLFGSAGTGKTFIACYKAILDVLDPENEIYDKIIIIRSAVQGRDMGFLPGTTEEKMQAFEAPYESIFADLTGKKYAYEKLKDMGKIEFMSSSFIRGITFHNAIVIVDEIQNFNFQELSTICTRIGMDSRLILCGDGKQDDLIYRKNDKSGFQQLLEVSRKMPEFRNFRFTSDDIVRSGFVKSFIMACEKLGIQ